MKNVRSLKLVPKKVDQMCMTMIFSEFNSSLTLCCFAMNTNLLRKEVKEDVHMSANSSMVNVCVVLRVFFVAVYSIFDKRFNALICTILNS